MMIEKPSMNTMQQKWSLEPGKMLLIDLQEGRLIDDDEVKTLLSTAKPLSLIHI